MGCSSCVARTYYDASPLPLILVGGRRSMLYGEELEEEEEGGGDCGCGCGGASAGSCSSGACELPRAAAALPAPRVVRTASDAELRSVQSAYLDATGQGRRERGAGTIMPVTAPRFMRSTLLEIRNMSNDDLDDREYALMGIASPTAEQGQELINVQAEIDRRRVADGTFPGSDTGTDPGREEAAAEDYDGMTEAEKRRLLEATARQLEAGNDRASAERRDRIIAQGLSSTFATFNSWLDGNYRTRIEEIHGNTSITLARISADDRERDRLYRLELARLRGPVADPGGGGGGGGGGAAVLGLLGLLATVMR